MALPFLKMHGLGNDFVLMEHQNIPSHLNLSELAAFVSDRHCGIGSDGLIVVTPPSDPKQFDSQFVFFNSDGSRAEMCGNGIRCFARYLVDQGLVSQSSFRVETLAGLMVPTVHPNGTVTVDMGAPILQPEKIPFASATGAGPVLNFPLRVEDQEVPVTLVSMGNPHCMIFQDDLAAPLDPVRMGPLIETHPSFPAKTNVEFVTVLSRTAVEVVVWERGCGFTQACGTGACATAVAAILQEKTEASVTVNLPGGALEITWDRAGSNHVMMTGPATYVFEGTLDLRHTPFGLTMDAFCES